MGLAFFRCSGSSPCSPSGSGQTLDNIGSSVNETKRETSTANATVTPNCAPYCVAPATLSATPLIASVAAPAALVDAGMFNATVPTGAVGVPPLDGKAICVDATGLPLPSTASGVPLAVT